MGRKNVQSYYCCCAIATKTLTADKSFETKQHKIPQKSGVSPNFTCMQANMVKLRGAYFTTAVVNALKR
jgi:hypothetical protein